MSDKSPFRLLLEQADALGIKRLRFDVQLENYTEDSLCRWIVVSEPDTPISVERELFHGQNGQHALTELLSSKKRL